MWWWRKNASNTYRVRAALIWAIFQSGGIGLVVASASSLSILSSLLLFMLFYVLVSYYLLSLSILSSPSSTGISVLDFFTMSLVVTFFTLSLFRFLLVCPTTPVDSSWMARCICYSYSSSLALIASKPTGGFFIPGRILGILFLKKKDLYL